MVGIIDANFDVFSVSLKENIWHIASKSSENEDRNKIIAL
jgi:hypothetical protein